MSNKKLHLVFGLVLAAFVGLIGSFTSAVSFKIDLGSMGPIKPSQMRPNMMLIHFTDKGNDFGGFVYFANGITSTGDVTNEKLYVQTSLADAVECRQMVKGFYYNAERGERLRPLDPDTADEWDMNLSFSGGIYTRCHGSGYEAALQNQCGSLNKESGLEDCKTRVANDFVDTHGYYGNITHVYSGLTFGLIAGTNYSNTSDKGVHPVTPLEASFVRIENKYPVGFIYDTNGGAGFVGCELKSVTLGNVYSKYINNGHSWEDVFVLNDAGTGVVYKDGGMECGGSAKNTLISVIVDGLVGITSEIDSKNSGIEGNQGNEKMQYFSSLDINNVKLINYAKQRSEILCRGKWKPGYNSSDWQNSSVVCLSGTDVDFGTINLIRNGEKTLILRGGDVTISNMQDFSEKNYNIFIDGGNLKIDDTGGDFKVFKKNGFISEGMTTGGFQTQVNSVWDYTGDEVAAGKFIKGNFIVDGHVKSVEGKELVNVYFIYGKLTSRDSVEDFKNTFKWKCNVGTGSDGTMCPISIQTDAGEMWENPYEGASLVIIDQNYPSPLYE